jgi:hypothetical protein
VATLQLAITNSGFNDASSFALGVNLSEQNADGTAHDGNIGAGGTGDNTAGNEGGTASNGNAGKNTLGSEATATSGKASATNKADATVGQSNDGSVDATQTADNSNISGGGGLNNSANLTVNQGSSVGTFQLAIANSGFNSARSGVLGINASGQNADSSAHDGNIAAGGTGDNTAGNAGGSATNTNAGTNTGTSSATASSGDASASNSSTVKVTQSNGGSVSATQNASNSNIS